MRRACHEGGWRAVVASELALHDYETNLEAGAIVKSIQPLTTEIHQRVVVEQAARGAADQR